MADASARRIVEQVMHDFVERLLARDVEGTLGFFHDDAVLFGSELGEDAQGIDELRAFFERLFGRPRTYGWTWEAPRTGSSGNVIWFAAPATVEIHGDDGTERSSPYRISGVLVRDDGGRWRFRLFNGAEPVPNEADRP